jgi:hypothetical protein
MESIILNEGAYKNPIKILTPEQVTEKIGKNFNVLRSDGKMDNIGWIVEQCLKKHCKHSEDEYEVTVIKLERKIPIVKKLITLGQLKKWNTPAFSFKEVLTVEQLTKYLGKRALSVCRSNGTIEKNCWTATHCFQLHPQDCEDYFVVAIFKKTEATCNWKVVTLRELKAWNEFPMIPVLPHEKRPDFYSQMQEVALQFSKEMREKYSTK